MFNCMHPAVVGPQKPAHIPPSPARLSVDSQKPVSVPGGNAFLSRHGQVPLKGTCSEAHVVFQVSLRDHLPRLKFHRFADFVLGASHLSPEEVSTHERQYGLGSTFLEEQLFSLQADSQPAS